jgi:hypothetical protein
MNKDQNEKNEAKPIEAAPGKGVLEASATGTDERSGAVEGKPDASAEVEPRPEPAKIAPSANRTIHAQAAALALALGLGWLGGWATFVTAGPAVDPAQAAIRSVDWAGLAAGLQKAEADAHRAAAKIQIVEASLGGVRDSVERAKQDAAARLTQVTQHLDRAQRADQETAAKLATLIERLQDAEQQSGARLAAIAERLDKAERPAPDPRLTLIAERLERMERQMAGANASSAKPASLVSTDQPAQTGAVPEAKPATIEGWVLRDVHRGVGLVEGRNGRLVEIVPGSNLPGVGRVEAIERRGKSWVVVTNRGLITSQQW